MHPLRKDREPSARALPTQGRVLVHAATVYDQVQPFITLGQEKRLNAWLAGRVAAVGAASVLDVGCGTGLLTYAIAQACPAARVTGIDASGPMLRVAIRKRSTERCAYRQAVAEELPFEDGAFQVVTSALFFHHVNLEYKKRALCEAHRVLGAGGRLLVADIDRPYSPLGWFMALAGWIVLRQPEIKENIDGVLEGLMAETGFQEIERIGRFSGYITVFSAEKASE